MVLNESLEPGIFRTFLGPLEPFLVIYGTFLGSWTCKEPFWEPFSPEGSKYGTKRVLSRTFFSKSVQLLCMEIRFQFFYTKFNFRVQITTRHSPWACNKQISLTFISPCNHKSTFFYSSLFQNIYINHTQIKKLHINPGLGRTINCPWQGNIKFCINFCIDVQYKSFNPPNGIN